MRGRRARERETAEKHEWDGDVGRMPPGASNGRRKIAHIAGKKRQREEQKFPRGCHPQQSRSRSRARESVGVAVA